MMTTKTEQPTTNVYALISKVSAIISEDGISKSRKNAQQGYQFRGIDDIYNAIAPILAKSGLVILPRCTDHKIEVRETGAGKKLFCAYIKVDFDFVSSFDSSKHTITTYGEAMDMADKATNKAMSAAYKYAVMQAFCIPTEGDNDADSSTHESTPKKEAKKPATEKKPLEQSRLNSAILTIKDGSYTKEKLIASFDLTEAQLKFVDDALSNNAGDSQDEAAF